MIIIRISWTSTFRGCYQHFVDIVDIFAFLDNICFYYIMSYLACNFRPIFRIYSSSVSDWCSPTKKNQMNLVLNQGHLLGVVPVWFRLLCDVAFDVSVTPVGNDWLFYSYGWLFVLQCVMCIVNCLRTNDKF